jgi:hypothetical protein
VTVTAYRYTSTNPAKPLTLDPSTLWIENGGPFQPHTSAGARTIRGDLQHNRLYGPDGSLRGEQYRQSFTIDAGDGAQAPLRTARQIRARQSIAGRLLTGLRDLIFAIIGLSTFVVGSALALTLAFSATGSAGLALLAVLTWWLFCHVISERA